MAKKSKGKFEFSKIGGIISGISEKTSIEVESSSDNHKKNYISTGIHIFDALLSRSILNGGIADNRITAIAGPSSVGKSFICYNICREAQKQGYSIIYIDTEYSIEMEDLSNFGIDTSAEKLQLVRSNVVEELKVMLTQLLTQLKEAKHGGYVLDKTLIVIDSVGQLASRKEVNDANDNKHVSDMSRAKAIKSLFRIINADLGYLKIPMLVTNHTYMEMGLFPKQIMSGGSGLVYSASTIVMLSKAKLKTGDENTDLSLGQSGITVTAKADKNRIAKPSKVKFTINFDKGINRYDYLEHFCTAENFDIVGIAKGKMEIDRETGEEYFKPGGTRWYIKHLGKSVFGKNLYTSEVFTQEVLEALEPIIYEYFSYASLDEAEEMEKKFIEDSKSKEESEYVDVDLDDIDSDDLFG